jgi:hypothetical protein
MNPVRQLTTPAFVFAATMALLSCASSRHFNNKPETTAQNNPPKSIGSFLRPPKFPGFSLASLLPGPQVHVVQVRVKDLKPLLTGHERALAFESQRTRGFWMFGGPVDFKEPTLPEAGAELDGSLLPPRMP